ncbi:DnaB-like helicase C-terminal domain-containing protein [Acinetobacter sp. VNH17]|uniref:DNA 5'-3' helicase n=1 Tax=Acinetobacter thutiue TaxID=2998078 RepID=A0ABT7WKV1_9GAMM|nr:DnaB-like helicase C-terminal domain-containing protein [Acinetobacter thutiue]MCY6411217.1 AAA family ATPase [Acinetobacter thutiue]MDN0013319.1 DnaB-like helicase C-terminal domain-containing protein [Acinetobacter thutiue]
MEQAVLTALMTTALSYDVVGNDLDEDCFYPERHKQIYNAIVDLSNNNKPYDAVMVEQWLRSRNMLHLMGGEQYLMDLMAEAPSSFFNCDAYITQLKKFKAHRQVESIGQRITAMAQDMTQPDVFAEAENILGQTDSAEQNDNGSSFEEAIQSALTQMIEKAEAKHKNQFTGVQFNLPHLDRLIGTVQKGHFCVVGGRPGSGKSTLAQMLAINTAKVHGKGVLFVSAEMDRETLTNRMISALWSIPYHNIHNAELYDGLLGDYAACRQTYEKLPIWIQPKQKPSIGEVRSYARRAKRRYKGLGCIIVDYLQLLRDPSRKDRFHEVSSISRELKSMAKEFECPVIALVQLNREAEKGKQPKASDIKESGQIEQDADQIILVNPLVDKDNLTPLGMTQLCVVKNRHGKKGNVCVRDYLDTCRFKCVEEQTDQ